MAGKEFGTNSKMYDASIKGYMNIGNGGMAAILKEEMSEAQKGQEDYLMSIINKLESYNSSYLNHLANIPQYSYTENCICYVFLVQY